MFKTSSNHVLSSIFATFSQNTHLNRCFYAFCLFPFYGHARTFTVVSDTFLVIYLFKNVFLRLIKPAKPVPAAARNWRRDMDLLSF